MGNYERDSICELKRGLLVPVVVLAELPAVVAVQHYNCVVLQPEFSQRVEHPAQLLLRQLAGGSKVSSRSKISSASSS